MGRQAAVVLYVLALDFARYVDSYDPATGAA